MTISHPPNPCSKCGTALPSTGGRCPNCGAERAIPRGSFPPPPMPGMPVGSMLQGGLPISRPPPYRPSAARPPAPRKSQTRNVLIAVATVAAVAVIGGATWAVYPRATPTPSARASVSAAPAPSAAPVKPRGKLLDTDRTLAEARRRALKWTPEAVLIKIEAGPMRAGSVDAAAGGKVRMHFAKPGGKLGPGAKVGPERFIVSDGESGPTDAEEKATDEARGVADPECGLHQAWRKAVAAGLPSSAEPTFSYAYSAKHDRAVWQADVPGDPKLSRTLDGRTCNILTR